MQAERILSWETHLPPQPKRMPTLSHILLMPEYNGPSNRLYFIRSSEHLKVGISGDVRLRLRQLQAGNHEILEIVAALPGGPEHEAYVHDCLSNERVRGEWFRITPRVQAFLDTLHLFKTKYLRNGR